MSAFAIDPRNWELDRSLVCLPDQNPSARIVSRETIPSKSVLSENRSIAGLLPPSSTPFVMTNTARFRRCACSAGYADTCTRRSDRQNPPTFGCHPYDWSVPDRFFITSAGDRINPLIRSWINAMMPTRPIDRDFIRFIGWITRPTARLVKTVTTTKASTPPPALRRVTRDSILSEIERTLDMLSVTE
jgi:hypothetical protein